MASENTNAKPSVDALVACLRTMTFYLKEVHADELNDGHGGDDQDAIDSGREPYCSYCEEIQIAERLIAEFVAAKRAQSPAEPSKLLDVGLLMAPNGKRITRIEEQVLVDYELLWVERDEAGEITFDYDASQSSEVSWDSADPTVDEDGEYTFYDEDGGAWKGSQLVKSTLPPPESDDYDSSKDDWYGDSEEEGDEEEEGGEEE